MPEDGAMPQEAVPKKNLKATTKETKVLNDKKDFVNPSGFWSHDGTYMVELTRIEDPTNTIVPNNPDNKISGDIIIIRNGKLGQSMGGITMEDSDGKSFHFGYISIKCIRKENGSLLWVNNNHRE
jgi:hypothetical protein